MELAKRDNRSRSFKLAYCAIHTLAIAVMGVLWAYAHKLRQRPSAVAQMIESNPALTRIKDPQNFFKHGNTGRKKRVSRVAHFPEITDLILADNVSTFNRLFMISNPLMETFLLRYALSFPESGIKLKALEMKLVGSGHDLSALAKLNRKAFYELVIPYSLENLRGIASGRAHSTDPPP